MHKYLQSCYAVKRLASLFKLGKKLFDNCTVWVTKPDNPNFDNFVRFYFRWKPYPDCISAKPASLRRAVRIQIN